MGSLFQCSSAPRSSPRKQKLSTAQSHSSNPFFLLMVYFFSRYFLVTNWFGLQFILQLLVRKKELLSESGNSQTPLPFYFLLFRPFLLHKVHVCDRRHLSTCANVARALGILHLFLNRKTKWKSCLLHHWNVGSNCLRNHIIRKIGNLCCGMGKSPSQTLWQDTSDMPSLQRAAVENWHAPLCSLLIYMGFVCASCYLYWSYTK